MRIWLARIVVLVLALLAGVYAAFPTVAGWLGSTLVSRGGAGSLVLVAHRPTVDGVHVESFQWSAGGATLRGTDLDISWLPGGLLRGKLKTLTARELDLVMDLVMDPAALPGARSASVDAVAEGDVPAVDLSVQLIESYFARSPFEEVQVGRLSVSIPGLDFTARGSARLDRQVLELALTGVSPEQAQGLGLDLRLNRHAEILLRLAAEDSGAEPFLTVRSTLPVDTLRLQTRFHLAGFVLQLVESLSGLPQGNGSMRGAVELTHAWPPGSSTGFDGWSASGELQLDWQSADGRIRAAGMNGALSLTDGRFSWSAGDNPQGRLIWASETTQVNFIPGEMQGSLADSRLTAAGTISARIGADLPVTPQASSAGTTLLPLELEGAAGLSVDLSDSQRIGLQGDLASMVQISGQQLPLKMELTAALLEDALEAEALVSSGPIDSLSVHLVYPLTGASARIDASHVQTFSAPLLAALWPGWDQPYDLDRGELRLAASLEVAAAGPAEGALSATLSAVDGHYSEAAIRGASGTLRARVGRDGLTLAPSELRIALLDIGLPLTDLSTRLSGNMSLLHVDESRGRVLGGNFRLQPFDYRVEDGHAELQIDLDGLSLAELLALEGDDLTGTGSIDGEIPLAVRGGRVTVTDGALRARPPGGELVLDSAIAGALAQPGLDIALGALTNFRYDALSAVVDYSESGDLQLGVRLEGHNPAVEKGRAIHYNLNLSENVPVLLQSLRLKDEFAERIERQVLR